MNKIIMMALAAGFGLAGSAVAASGDALQQKVDSLEKELTELKVQMQQRNSELLDELVAREGVSQSAETGLTAGYDKGFFIKTQDDVFRLNIGARLQFRHTYGLMDSTGSNSDTSSSRFELERTRLMFSGQAMKNVTFMVQLDVDDDGNSNASDTGHNADLYNAWVAYTVSPEFGLRFGCNDLQYGKQRPTSSGKFMGIDRMMTTQIFDMGRSTGVEAFGSIPVGDVKMAYSAGVFNSLGDNDKTKLADNDNNPAFVSRIMIPVMGTVKDFSNESDLAYHTSPVMMIGASYAFANNKVEGGTAGTDTLGVLAAAQNGTIGSVTGQGKVNMLGADISYKCKGFSATLEGFYQRATFDEAIVGYDGTAFDNLGWTAQAGQFIVPEEFELFARVGGVSVDCDEDMYEYSGGWNYYINGQNLKLSMDLTYIDELVNRSSTANYNQGVNGESLFLVRTQLQFQF